MPTYEFETEEGVRLEEYFPMRDAPRANDEWIEIQGQRCKRIISSHQTRVIDDAHISNALPRKGSGIETVWDKFTPDGKPYFEGSKDIREFEARSTFKHSEG